MIRNELIKELRIQNGYTLKDIAQKLAVSEATAQRYETAGIKTVPYDKIVAIAEIYGCDPEYLMGWSAEYKKADLKELGDISKKEEELLKAYRNAPQDVQDGIRKILGLKKE